MVFSTAKKKRWTQAQKYERNYWLSNKERVQSDEWIKIKGERAESLTTWMSKFITISSETKILQIGAGGEGEINFFPVGVRFAVDPLANFYKEHFQRVIDRQVEFRQARGEELPFPDDFFDGIIMTNVLDHTEDPNLVLKEIQRTLKQRGVAIIEVHTFWAFSFFVKKYLLKNIGHPHVFTLNSLKRSIARNALIILETRHDAKIHMYLGHWLKYMFLSRKYARFSVTKYHSK